MVAGGGRNHRYNLSDAAMLKDNHIDAYGSLTNAVNALRAKTGHMVKIEVEVDSLELLEEALNVKADIIMLDNMSYEQMAEAVKITDGRALLEASGNITLENIAEVAKTGVDIISPVSYTHLVTGQLRAGKGGELFYPGIFPQLDGGDRRRTGYSVHDLLS